jgi:L-alanine-DL-glutamate epimerase-like enolase superfamily enzyme
VHHPATRQQRLSSGYTDWEEAMKITDIKAYALPHVVGEPTYHWRQGLPTEGPVGATVYSGLLKVETDEGIVGHAYARSGYRLADITLRRLKTEFIGQDPLLTEHLWHRIWEIDRLEEFQVHDLGLMDIACWDIKSQAAGLPIYQLLGGIDPKVPAYCSTVTWDTMDEYERYIKTAMDEGFFAFKLHASGDPRWDAELSHNLRAWTGPEADLMFDGSAGWDYVTALWFGRQLEEAGFYIYEEPMREFDLVSYAELCAALDIPVLAAETCDGCHWNAATWIQFGALDMMRVSVGFKGGFTGAMKVAHLAESCGMRAQVHGGGWHNAQLCAAIPNNDYYEQIVMDGEHIKRLKDSGPLSIVDGYLTVPETPGAGPQPDWEEVKARAALIV